LKGFLKEHEVKVLLTEHMIGKVKIIYAWEAHHNITGVPLHIKQLVDLEANSQIHG
jgi:hypothetical protein